VKRVAERPFIPCRTIVALLSEYLEGSLPPGDAHDLEAHLAICPPCLDFLENLRTTRAAAGALREESIPDECRRRLRQFLAPRLRDGFRGS